MKKLVLAALAALALLAALASAADAKPLRAEGGTAATSN